MPSTLPNAEGTEMNKMLCPHEAYILLEGYRHDVICQMGISTEKKSKVRKKDWN